MAPDAVTFQSQDEYREIFDLLTQLDHAERERLAALERLQIVMADARAGSERVRQAFPDLFR